jgi:hypothetical protein
MKLPISMSVREPRVGDPDLAKLGPLSKRASFQQQQRVSPAVHRPARGLKPMPPRDGTDLSSGFGGEAALKQQHSIDPQGAPSDPGCPAPHENHLGAPLAEVKIVAMV